MLSFTAGNREAAPLLVIEVGVCINEPPKEPISGKPNLPGRLPESKFPKRAGSILCKE